MSKHSNVSKHSCVLNEKQPQGRRPSLRDVARCGWLVKGHEDFSSVGIVKSPPPYQKASFGNSEDVVDQVH
jgi:hypothetical protein